MKRIALFLLSCLLTGSMMAQQWTGTWATATEKPFGKGDVPQKVQLANNTLRQVVHVSLGGGVLRMELSNTFGDEPLEIRSVYIADAATGEQIDAKTAQYLKFGGKQSVTIAPHQVVFSDALKYKLKPLQRLSVTISYGAMPKTVTTHRGSRTTSYIMEGDCKPRQAFVVGERLEHWYTIAAIDVDAATIPASAASTPAASTPAASTPAASTTPDGSPSGTPACIAVIGNSITDGRGTTTDAQNRWTDVLAEQLQGKVGVLNLGIGGNCVLQGGISQPAVDRFDRDILSQRGVTHLIIYEGINDIGGSKNVEKTSRLLINAYKDFIAQARKRGWKVYMGTITQLGNTNYWSYFHEACRQTVNEWIRTTKDIDGVIDFDQVLRDPQQPTQMRGDYQFDWLHPNAKGYRAMGEAAGEHLKTNL